MKTIRLFTLILMALALLCGCTAQSDQVAAPVTRAPEWVDAEMPSGEGEEIRTSIFCDYTQSMFGFAGSMDSPLSRMVLAITDYARFTETVTTHILIPDETQNLVWTETDPLTAASALIQKEAGLYTFKGDFAGEGGPIASVFQGEPDPAEVKILFTDGLEQGFQIPALLQYAQKLFKENSHMMLRVYLAESDFDGTVYYPVVKNGTTTLQNSQYSGERPFIIIALGQADGVMKLHQVLQETGLPFIEFMVENKRPKPEQVEFKPGECLQQNLLIDDVAGSRCTLNLVPMELEGNELSYTFRKITAGPSDFCRLSLQGLTGQKSSLDFTAQWYRWVPASEALEDGTVPHHWEACPEPEGVEIRLERLENGTQVITGRTEEETGLADLSIPAGKRCWELSLVGDEALPSGAYAVQVTVTAPSAANPLASVQAFEAYNAPLATLVYAEDVPEILKRIPDLSLLLKSLATLDAPAQAMPVAQVRVIFQTA